MSKNAYIYAIIGCNEKLVGGIGMGENTQNIRGTKKYPREQITEAFPKETINNQALVELIHNFQENKKPREDVQEAFFSLEKNIRLYFLELSSRLLEETVSTKQQRYLSDLLSLLCHTCENTKYLECLTNLIFYFYAQQNLHTKAQLA